MTRMNNVIGSSSKAKLRAAGTLGGPPVPGGGSRPELRGSGGGSGLPGGGEGFPHPQGSAGGPGPRFS